jgi:hypothetical protein
VIMKNLDDCVNVYLAEWVEDMRWLKFKIGCMKKPDESKNP